MAPSDCVYVKICFYVGKMVFIGIKTYFPMLSERWRKYESSRKKDRLYI